MNSNKKINARVEKWRVMLGDGLFKDEDLLHSRVRKGVPQPIRMIVWPELVRLRKHIEQRSVDINYQQLTNSLSNNIYEIALDIPRTFPEEEDSTVLRKSMNNVLKAIAIVHPKIGYCQGMNFVTLRILQILDDEEAFWLLDYLFINDENLRNNFIDPKSSLLHHNNFEVLLSRYNPTILGILQNKGIHLLSYTMKCFMTLFSSILKQEFFNRVFEIYLVEGWSIFYAFSLALFRRYEKEFVKLPMEESQFILGKKIFEIDDIEEVLGEAYRLDIKKEDIQQIERSYKSSLRESQKFNETSEIKKREENNRNHFKFVPQAENIGNLVFQNKAEEMNFDNLYILKGSKDFV